MAYWNGAAWNKEQMILFYVFLFLLEAEPKEESCFGD